MDTSLVKRDHFGVPLTLKSFTLFTTVRFCIVAWASWIQYAPYVRKVCFIF
jgi:hypothetical protein